MLVAIAVVGVLLTISVPAIRMARQAGASAVSLSNLRENVATLHAWAASHSDEAPRAPEFVDGMGKPQPLYSFPETERGGFMTDYFGQDMHWNLTLYKAGEEPSEAWWPPGDLSAGWAERFRAKPFGTSYRLSHAYLAGPEHWRPGQEERQSIDMWRAVRLAETDSPSGKALLHTYVPSIGRDESAVPPGRVEVGFTDGHAAAHDASDAALAVPNRWRGFARQPLDGTPNGVTGTDI